MKNFILILLFLYCKIAFCSIINIPADKSNIQVGINSANKGDTVLVAPGKYMESINLSVESITLASWYLTTGDTSYISRTILDGNGRTVISINSPAGDDVSIVGLTIQNGDDGISPNVKFRLINNHIMNCNDGIDYESGSGGLCKNNIFINNRDDGIDLDGTIDILIEDNLIANNDDDGIEIRLHEYTGDTVFNIIKRNQIYGNGEDGIQLIDYPDSSSRIIIIEKNLIYNNDMAGIGCMSDGNTLENYEGAEIPEPIYLFNNTIDNNNYGITGGKNLVAINNIISNSNITAAKNVTANSIIAYSLFYGNGVDTVNCHIDLSTIIFDDPQFMSDYELLESSPCINAGTAFFLWQSSIVLDLSPNEYFGTSPDMGAIENQIPITSHFSKIESDFRMYPNPNNGFFYLDFNGNAKNIKFGIFNSKGEQVINSKPEDRKTQIDLSSYPKGLYLIKLSGDRMNITKKILIN